MNIILLSGGSGQRLWPLSNDIRSKQFIKVFQNEKGEYESMVQRVCRQIVCIDENARIVITTGKSQVSAIQNQVGKKVNICVEPVRRDTFPAILLASAYMKDVMKIEEDEPVIVCPVDPYVDYQYFKSMMELESLVKKVDSNLFLMGAEPTYPSTKYGYIIPDTNARYSRVKEFKEKPEEEIAKMYLKKGALWNCGVFGFRLGYILEIASKKFSFKNYEELKSNYSRLEKISFDYAVVEKESNICSLRFSGKWKDIGTWNTFVEEMSEPLIGDVQADQSCRNVNVINELDIPILAMGINNCVIAASNDGILVSDKEMSSFIKPYVEQFEREIRYAEKSWGSFTVLDVTEKSITIKVRLNAGNRMNYHSHEYRKETWNVINGSGKVIVDGKSRKIVAGDVVDLPVGCKHTVIAENELILIEVQYGIEISVHDKIKYKFPDI